MARRTSHLITSCLLSLAAFLADGSVSSLHGADAPPPNQADAATYLKHIKPLLESKCIACHGPVRREAGLRLDAAALVRSGSENGPVADPKSPPQSVLIARIRAADDQRMPPASEGVPLNSEEIQRLQDWIAADLPAPADETYLSGPRDHWAYQPLAKPPIPELNQPTASEGASATLVAANPIDRFLLAAQQQQGLMPLDVVDEAARRRRASFDLIGLPLAPQDLLSPPGGLASSSTESPVSFSRYIDRLLARPEHGERWGRHWMDVWRYSDWDGYKDELRGSQRHIWHWRDWIVESLNDNKPYDVMVRQMLAADELAPSDENNLRATGFLARNFHVSNRNIWLDATVEHTAKAFLGITLNCSRCHDHKYDPIPQVEYYRFRAIFEPYHVRTDLIEGVTDPQRNGIPRAYDSKLDAETVLFERGNEKTPRKDFPITPAPPEFLGLPFNVAAVDLPLSSYYPALRAHVPNDLLREAEANFAQAASKLAAANTPPSPAATAEATDGAKSEAAPAKTTDSIEMRLARLRFAVAQAKLQSLRMRISADQAMYQGGSPESIKLLAHSASLEERRLRCAEAELQWTEKEHAYESAQAANQSDEKKRQAAIDAAEKQRKTARETFDQALTALQQPADEKYTGLGTEYPRQSSGRRAALAQWITSRDNPLAARVGVNHIWTRHFGKPLVDNVFDFGIKTPEPPLRRLLDYLACEWIESGWDMKHLHRLIVTSDAFRRATDGPSETVNHNVSIDPDNRYFWRGEIQRLDAEVIRDSLLEVAARTDRRMGGPDLDHEQGDKLARRSIYFRHAYEKQMTMLVVFDAASPNECYRRSPSVIPQQALALANGELARSMARLTAREAWKQTEGQSDQPSRFIEWLYARLLGRAPTESERELCMTFLREQTERISNATASSAPLNAGPDATIAASSDATERARESLAHVLLNHHEFVTLR